MWTRPIDATRGVLLVRRIAAGMRLSALCRSDHFASRKEEEELEERGKGRYGTVFGYASDTF